MTRSTNMRTLNKKEGYPFEGAISQIIKSLADIQLITRNRQLPIHVLALIAFILILSASVQPTDSAALNGPTGKQRSSRDRGCFYMLQHYKNGEPIKTDEPCLNCTCENSMLMCYLRVCPYVKPVGDRCIIERVPGECCPRITCPNVAPPSENFEQELEPETVAPTQPAATTVASTTTAQSSPSPPPPPSSSSSPLLSGETLFSAANNATSESSNSGGCMIGNNYYPEGAQMPSDKSKSCEICYCIRGSAACVMQDCALEVSGCAPIYTAGGCCPTRYNCSAENAFTTPRPSLMAELSRKAVSQVGKKKFWDLSPTSKFTTLASEGISSLLSSTTAAPRRPIVLPDFGRASVSVPGPGCRAPNSTRVYADGERVPSKNKCEHCYCMRGELVCAVQECRPPCDGCVPIIDADDQCCPKRYECAAPTQRVPLDNVVIGDQATGDSTPSLLTTPQLPSTEASETEAALFSSSPAPPAAPTSTPHNDKISSPLPPVGADQNFTLSDASEPPAPQTTTTTTTTTSELVTPSTASDLVSPAINSAASPAGDESIVSNKDAPMLPEVSVMTTRQTKPPLRPISPKLSTNEDDVGSELVPEAKPTRPDTTSSTSNVDGFNLNGEREQDLSDVGKSAGRVEAPEGSVPISGQSPDSNEIVPPSLTSTPRLVFQSSTPLPPIATDVLERANGSPETSSANANERKSRPLVVPSQIPGEGSCRYNNRLYENGQEVKSRHNCTELCMCINSVVYCDEVDCPRAPENPERCQKITTTGECCPKYICPEEATSTTSASSSIPETTTTPVAPLIKFDSSTSTPESASQAFDVKSTRLPELDSESNTIAADRLATSSVMEKIPATSSENALPSTESPSDVDVVNSSPSVPFSTTVPNDVTSPPATMKSEIITKSPEIAVETTTGQAMTTTPADSGISRLSESSTQSSSVESATVPLSNVISETQPEIAKSSGTAQPEATSSETPLSSVSSETPIMPSLDQSAEAASAATTPSTSTTTQSPTSMSVDISSPSVAPSEASATTQTSFKELLTTLSSGSPPAPDSSSASTTIGTISSEAVSDPETVQTLGTTTTTALPTSVTSDVTSSSSEPPTSDLAKPSEPPQVGRVADDSTSSSVPSDTPTSQSPAGDASSEPKQVTPVQEAAQPTTQSPSTVAPTLLGSADVTTASPADESVAGFSTVKNLEFEPVNVTTVIPLIIGSDASVTIPSSDISGSSTTTTSTTSTSIAAESRSEEEMLATTQASHPQESQPQESVTPSVVPSSERPATTSESSLANDIEISSIQSQSTTMQSSSSEEPTSQSAQTETAATATPKQTESSTAQTEKAPTRTISADGESDPTSREPVVSADSSSTISSQAPQAEADVGTHKQGEILTTQPEASSSTVQDVTEGIGKQTTQTPVSDAGTSMATSSQEMTSRAAQTESPVTAQTEPESSTGGPTGGASPTTESKPTTQAPVVVAESMTTIVSQEISSQASQPGVTAAPDSPTTSGSLESSTSVTSEATSRATEAEKQVTAASQAPAIVAETSTTVIAREELIQPSSPGDIPSMSRVDTGSADAPSNELSSPPESPQPGVVAGPAAETFAPPSTITSESSPSSISSVDTSFSSAPEQPLMSTVSSENLSVPKQETSTSIAPDTVSTVSSSEPSTSTESIGTSTVTSGLENVISEEQIVSSSTLTPPRDVPSIMNAESLSKSDELSNVVVQGSSTTEAASSLPTVSVKFEDLPSTVTMSSTTMPPSDVISETQPEIAKSSETAQPESTSSETPLTSVSSETPVVPSVDQSAEAAAATTTPTTSTTTQSPTSMPVDISSPSVAPSEASATTQSSLKELLTTLSSGSSPAPDSSSASTTIGTISSEAVSDPETVQTLGTTTTTALPTSETSDVTSSSSEPSTPELSQPSEPPQVGRVADDSTSSSVPLETSTSQSPAGDASSEPKQVTPVQEAAQPTTQSPSTVAPTLLGSADVTTASPADESVAGFSTVKNLEFEPVNVPTVIPSVRGSEASVTIPSSDISGSSTTIAKSSETAKPEATSSETPLSSVSSETPVVTSVDQSGETAAATATPTTSTTTQSPTSMPVDISSSSFDLSEASATTQTSFKELLTTLSSGSPPAPDSSSASTTIGTISSEAVSDPETVQTLGTTTTTAPPTSVTSDVTSSSSEPPTSDLAKPSEPPQLDRVADDSTSSSVPSDTPTSQSPAGDASSEPKQVTPVQEAAQPTTQSPSTVAPTLLGSADVTTASPADESVAGFSTVKNLEFEPVNVPTVISSTIGSGSSVTIPSSDISGSSTTTTSTTSTSIAVESRSEEEMLATTQASQPQESVTPSVVPSSERPATTSESSLANEISSIQSQSTTMQSSSSEEPTSQSAQTEAAATATPKQTEISTAEGAPSDKISADGESRPTTDLPVVNAETSTPVSSQEATSSQPAQTEPAATTVNLGESSTIQSEAPSSTVASDSDSKMTTTVYSTEASSTISSQSPFEPAVTTQKQPESSVGKTEGAFSTAIFAADGESSPTTQAPAIVAETMTTMATQEVSSQAAQTEATAVTDSSIISQPLASSTLATSDLATSRATEAETPLPVTVATQAPAIVPETSTTVIAREELIRPSSPGDIPSLSRVDTGSADAPSNELSSSPESPQPGVVAGPAAETSAPPLTITSESSPSSMSSGDTSFSSAPEQPLMPTVSSENLGVPKQEVSSTSIGLDKVSTIPSSETSASTQSTGTSTAQQFNESTERAPGDPQLSTLSSQSSVTPGLENVISEEQIVSSSTLTPPQEVPSAMNADPMSKSDELSNVVVQGSSTTEAASSLPTVSVKFEDLPSTVTMSSTTMPPSDVISETQPEIAKSSGTAQPEATSSETPLSSVSSETPVVPSVDQSAEAAAATTTPTTSTTTQSPTSIPVDISSPSVAPSEASATTQSSLKELLTTLSSGSPPAPDSSSASTTIGTISSEAVSDPETVQTLGTTTTTALPTSETSDVTSSSSEPSTPDLAKPSEPPQVGRVADDSTSSSVPLETSTSQSPGGDVSSEPKQVTPVQEAAQSTTQSPSTVAPTLLSSANVTTASPADESVAGFSTVKNLEFEPVNVTTVIPSVRGSEASVTIPSSDISGSSTTIAKSSETAKPEATSSETPLSSISSETPVVTSVDQSGETAAATATPATSTTTQSPTSMPVDISSSSVAPSESSATTQSSSKELLTTLPSDSSPAPDSSSASTTMGTISVSDPETVQTLGTTTTTTALPTNETSDLTSSSSEPPTPELAKPSEPPQVGRVADDSTSSSVSLDTPTSQSPAGDASSEPKQVTPVQETAQPTTQSPSTVAPTLLSSANVTTASPADEFVTGFSTVKNLEFKPVNVTTVIPSIRGSEASVTIPWSDISSSSTTTTSSTSASTSTASRPVEVETEKISANITEVPPASVASTEPEFSTSKATVVDTSNIGMHSNQTRAFTYDTTQMSVGTEADYEEVTDEPGCEYEGKAYSSAQQIPRSHPCDFCFCFRGDIICLQQTCPPPVPHCFETVIDGFCCPRYECPVHTVRTAQNASGLTVTPYETHSRLHSNSPHELDGRSGNATQGVKGTSSIRGCFVDNKLYGVGKVIESASGPCLECRCDRSGMMKCNPKECTPEDPLLQQINREVLQSTLSRSQRKRR